MPYTVTRMLEDDAQRRATIAHERLDRATDDLERLDRLLQAGELDRRELQQAASRAVRLTLVAVEEPERD